MILMIDVSDNIGNCLELLNKENMFKTCPIDYKSFAAYIYGKNKNIQFALYELLMSRLCLAKSYLSRDTAGLVVLILRLRTNKPEQQCRPLERRLYLSLHYLLLSSFR